MADDHSAERTEAPTARRLREARRRGQVATSRDLSAAIALIVVFATMVIVAESWLAGLLAYLRAGLQAGCRPLSAGGAWARGIEAFGAALAPALGAAWLAAAAIGGLQTGGLVSLEAVRLDLGRVSPSFKRVFSLAAALEIGKGLIKASVIAVAAWWALWPVLGSIVHTTGARGIAVLRALGSFGERLGLRIGIAAAGLGALDLLMQRHRHMRGLRMTRDEVKREHKESEGDPHHKAERHRLHQEVLEQRMVADVRKADFVVVNPDHIAVAVRYDRDSDAAPVVVAKGERLLAERIKQVAREHGVPIFRDVTLARSLRGVDEGDEIPEALYEAVAEILRVLQAASGAGKGSAGPGVLPGTPPAAPASWRRA